MSRDRHAVVIGAGMGGLAAAIDLASAGMRVTVFERQAVPGGKMHELEIGGSRIDSGPTVLTMRWVFDALFEAAGASLDGAVRLRPAERLARHAWPDGSRLDLYPDVSRSAAAIAEFAGPAEADAYRRFAGRARQVFETLDAAFMRAERPGPFGLTLSLGARGWPRLVAARPFTTLWRELGRRFSDPRLQQLFARYATYTGSSPFAAPATLMLIAYAEQAGVWYVENGMQRLAEALAGLAVSLGCDLETGCGVRKIEARRGSVTGVELDDGRRLRCDAVVYNGDAAALAAGLAGDDVAEAHPPRRREPRSLSAITWSLRGRAQGFPLDYHTVFFGDDYADEFAAIFERKSLTTRPTVYVCAQDRPAPSSVDGQPERLFLLINAPPRPFGQDEIGAIAERTFAQLAAQGLAIDAEDDGAVVTSPDDYAARFPGSGGSIYGWPTHGWSGSFRRSGSRAAVGGLYLAGGTVHPGPGVPMAALSGRIAARSVRSDLGI